MDDRFFISKIVKDTVTLYSYCIHIAIIFLAFKIIPHISLCTTLYLMHKRFEHCETLFTFFSSGVTNKWDNHLYNRLTYKSRCFVRATQGERICITPTLLNCFDTKLCNIQYDEAYIYIYIYVWRHKRDHPNRWVNYLSRIIYPVIRPLAGIIPINETLISRSNWE